MEEIIKNIYSMIEIEESRDFNKWDKSTKISIDIIGKIIAGTLVGDDKLYRFLEDVDVRKKDSKFADDQREAIKKYISTLV